MWSGGQSLLKAYKRNIVRVIESREDWSRQAIWMSGCWTFCLHVIKTQIYTGVICEVLMGLPRKFKVSSHWKCQSQIDCWSFESHFLSYQTSRSSTLPGLKHYWDKSHISLKIELCKHGMFVQYSSNKMGFRIRDAVVLFSVCAYYPQSSKFVQDLTVPAKESHGLDSGSMVAGSVRST